MRLSEVSGLHGGLGMGWVFGEVSMALCGSQAT